MFGKKFTVEEKIRLQDELQELLEKYGIENVNDVFQQYIASYQGTQKLVNQEAQKPVQNQVNESAEQIAVHQRELEKENEAKEKLPPSVRSVEDFEKGCIEVCSAGTVNPQIINTVKEFLQGSKKIYLNDLSDKNFIMSLSSELFPERVFNNPAEDWIDYNAERIRTYLKRHLRLKGYQFLDSEVEVGKMYDPRKHNCIEREYVKDSTMDGRVLKLVNEGLIIGKILHINCNVIVGKYAG